MFKIANNIQLTTIHKRNIELRLITCFIRLKLQDVFVLLDSYLRSLFTKLELIKIACGIITGRCEDKMSPLVISYSLEGSTQQSGRGP